MRKVHIGQYFRTIHDLVDGFAGKDRKNAERKTLPRDHQDSELIGWIIGQTRFGPVLEDRTPCRTHIFLSVAHFDHHAHLREAQGLDGSSLGCVAPLRILKVIHSQHVSSTTP